MSRIGDLINQVDSGKINPKDALEKLRDIYDDSFMIYPKTVYDEQRIDILKEAYSKYDLTELQKRLE